MPCRLFRVFGRFLSHSGGGQRGNPRRGVDSGVGRLCGVMNVVVVVVVAMLRRQTERQ